MVPFGVDRVVVGRQEVPALLSIEGIPQVVVLCALPPVPLFVAVRVEP